MTKAKKIWKIPERFVKAMLLILSFLLIFGGPTYLMNILQRSGLSPLLFNLVGLAAFTAGIILFFHLAKGKNL
ncbi:MAG: hypothetical protein JSV85_03550 [Candidatus Bathyarchaeota archaeon]|nr:MAG: hypothetical protein JSV85_03550 [Candidatus Bathyarchaeota archaeon]